MVLTILQISCLIYSTYHTYNTLVCVYLKMSVYFEIITNETKNSNS